MSKTLETKRKILGLLKKREMTLSGLSEALNLSNATVSQHIEELQRTGAIERVENEHFRKLKYYRLKEAGGQVVSTYVKYLMAVGVVMLVVIEFYLSGTSIGTQAGATNKSIVTAPSMVTRFQHAACPMLFYELNGSIGSHAGVSLYYINYSGGTVADYVISKGGAGSLYVTERVNNVLDNSLAQNSSPVRSHTAFLTSLNQGTPPVPQAAGAIGGSTGAGMILPPNISSSVPPPSGNFTSGSVKNATSAAVSGAASSVFNASAYGVSVQAIPENFSLISNETVNFAVEITASSAASSNTYWLDIDGPCGGGVPPVLLTVGDAPYNGTIAASTGIWN